MKTMKKVLFVLLVALMLFAGCEIIIDGDKSGGGGNSNGTTNGGSGGGNSNATTNEGNGVDNGSSNGANNGSNNGNNNNFTVITIAAIQGVTAPVTGATPVTAITENSQYSGTVTWSDWWGDSTSTFAANTEYTATITLTAKAGYTMQGVGYDFFTVAGATWVSNYADSGDITAAFPQTAATVINIADIQGVTTPVTGETPVNEIYDYENGQYSGFVTWSPNHYTFEASTIYTATITLTAKTGYTLQGIGNNFFTVTGATSVSNNANSGVITAIFPQTSATLSYDKIEYYWIDQHGSLATTSGGATVVGVGETLTITAQSEGYTAKQWYLNGISTDQNGDTYIFSSVVTGNHIVSWVVEKDSKVYNTNITIAVKNKLTVSFDINGGTGTTPDLKTVIVGSSITLPSGSGLTKAGYTFGGWNNNASGTGYNYNAGTSYTPSNSETLYAKWIKSITPGTTKGTAIELTLNSWEPGEMTDNVQELWYTINLTGRGDEIRWRTNNVTGGNYIYTLWRAKVYIYDENGAALYSNGIQSIDVDSKRYNYYFFFSAPGRIYIKVTPEELWNMPSWEDTNGTFDIGAFSR